jgi:hypothetical protein
MSFRFGNLSFDRVNILAKLKYSYAILSKGEFPSLRWMTTSN